MVRCNTNAAGRVYQPITIPRLPIYWATCQLGRWPKNRNYRGGAKPNMSTAKLAQAAAFSLCFFLQFLPSTAAAQNCDGKLAPGDLRRCEEMFTRQVENGSQT